MEKVSDLLMWGRAPPPVQAERDRLALLSDLNDCLGLIPFTGEGARARSTMLHVPCLRA
jgi:hypothetical protein